MSEAQVFDIEARTEAPLHGDETAVLRGMLAYQRDTLRWKCAGLTQQQLAITLPPSDLTLGGLMKHLALVESQWFDHWFRDAGFAPPFDTGLPRHRARSASTSPTTSIDSAVMGSSTSCRCLAPASARPCA